MNRIFLGIISIFVLLLCVEAGAQDFRKFRTTQQNITYTDRVLEDGRTIVEAILTITHTDLTQHPVDAKAHTDTTESEETLFLTQAAATALKAAIAASSKSKKEVLDAEIDATDKVKDANGNVLEEITHITFTDGRPEQNTSTAGTVVTKDNVRTSSVRAEFETIVEISKPIVSQN
ncbi:MAG: hypothetical protein VYB73_02550 [Verrucomicrobiota bacterium]|nr:hypothetical protein [Verrucomicrobiota bacterium]MEE2808167.1 hypothetical protein [Verrucomicrobiota bacterium]